MSQLLFIYFNIRTYVFLDFDAGFCAYGHSINWSPYNGFEWILRFERLPRKRIFSVHGIN